MGRHCGEAGTDRGLLLCSGSFKLDYSFDSAKPIPA